MDCGLDVDHTFWDLHPEDEVQKRSEQAVYPPAMLVCWALESMGEFQRGHWPCSSGSGTWSPLSRWNSMNVQLLLTSTTQLDALMRSAVQRNPSLKAFGPPFMRFSYKSLLMFKCSNWRG